MKILITGATGFIGKQLCYQLFSEGHVLVILSRNIEAAKKLLDLPVDYIEFKGKVFNLGSPENSLDQQQYFDGVINLAGESIANRRWSEGVKKKLIESRSTFSQIVIDSIKIFQTKKLNFAISASAIGYYPVNSQESQFEDSPKGVGFLPDLVDKWEKPWRNFDLSERVVILRIGVVLGRLGGAASKLKTIFQWGLGGSVGAGDQDFSWIHEKDLINIIRSSISDQKFVGTINCVAPKPSTNQLMAKALASALGRPSFLPAPQSAVKILLGEMATIVIDGQRVIPRKLQELGFKFDFEDIASAMEDLFGKKPVGKNGSLKQCEVFEAFQYIDKPLEEVFQFFSDPYNLESITPPLLSFKILKLPQEKMQANAQILYQLKIHGIPVKWKTLISEWQDKQYFVDTQLKGPYQIWHHRHEFMQVGAGTMMRDLVHYKVPLGALGNQFVGPFILRDIKTIFDYRRKIISEVLK